LKNLSIEKLAAALLVIFAALIAIAALYALIAAILAEINPVAAVATISVAVAGLAWVKKTSFTSKIMNRTSQPQKFTEAEFRHISEGESS
jgi:hypothetical protein